MTEPDVLDDEGLTLKEKMALLIWIPIRQRERWERMKKFHNTPNISIDTRHYFMSFEINLMRRQKQRLERIKKQLNN